jgi:type II pantothenate kinase
LSRAKSIDITENWKKNFNEDTPREEFPKLLVSIGSGVSMIKINSYNSFERVSGTMIGGGTLLGLSNLMTGERDFNTIIEKAQLGNNANVDFLVKDIYGDKSQIEGLSGDILASSFAKVANEQESGDIKNRYEKNDILNSLVTMISFNIGQLAYYCSSMNDIKTIYFVGSYSRDNYLAMQ